MVGPGSVHGFILPSSEARTRGYTEIGKVIENTAQFFLFGWSDAFLFLIHCWIGETGIAVDQKLQFFVREGVTLFTM